MANLLGATNPVPGYDNSTVNRNLPVSPENTQIQNVADPSRVSRADGKTEQQDNASEAGQQIRYDSNFQTFIQRLRGTPELTQTMMKLFAGQQTIVLSGMSEGIAQEISKALEMLHMDEGQLMDFITSQFKSSTRFGGALFAMLRSAYSNASSDTVRSDILQFVKSFSDYSSTSHLEGNLLRSMDTMADAMPESWAGKLRDLLGQLQNGVEAGDRRGNVQLLQREIFPYVADYIEQTHDMGLPRTLVTLMALDTARYENGSLENLLQSFHRLSGFGTLRNQLGGIDDKALLELLKSNEFTASPANSFADHLTAAASLALKGEGNAETQQILQQLVAAMLINESVYMSVNHFMIPIEMDGRMLFSELWVDPDEEEDKKGGGRDEVTQKFLLKMDVQSLGMFDVVFTNRKLEVDMNIACPDSVAPFSRMIENDISNILLSNGLTPSSVSVRKMERPVALTEVFPKLFEGKNGINVKV